MHCRCYALLVLCVVGTILMYVKCVWFCLYINSLYTNYSICNYNRMGEIVKKEGVLGKNTEA